MSTESNSVPGTALALYRPTPPEGGSRVVDQLSRDLSTRAREVARNLDLSSLQATIAFGQDAQARLAAFSADILGQINVGSDDDLTSLLTSFDDEIKGLNVKSLKEGDKKPGAVKGWLAKQFGQAKSALDEFRLKAEKVEAKVTEIQAKFEQARARMIAQHGQLNTFYDLNLEYFRALEVLIAAGELYLDERTAAYNARLNEVHTTGVRDVPTLQGLQREFEGLQRAEQRVQNLRKARLAAVVIAPAISMAQKNTEQIAATLDDMVNIAVPGWRTNILLHVLQAKQRGAVNLAKAGHKLSNDLMRSNFELLGQVQEQAAEAGREGIMDVDVIVESTEKLLGTLARGVELNQTAIAWRANERTKMLAAEQVLKEGLLASTLAAGKQTTSPVGISHTGLNLPAPVVEISMVALEQPSPTAVTEKVASERSITVSTPSIQPPVQPPPAATPGLREKPAL